MATDVSLASQTASLLSGSIKWSGLASGVDFASVVEQLVELEMTSVNRLESWKTDWEDKITAIQGMNTRMASVLSFVKGFDTYEEFYSRTSSSSNSSVLTTTNTSSASPGSHTIVVGQDIRGITASKSVDPTADVSGGGGAGAIVINIGSGTTVSVDVTSGDTISDIKTRIETAVAAQAPGELTVSIVDDKDRSGTMYQRLLLTAANGGSDNELSVSTDITGLNLDENSVDSVYEKTWVGTASPSASPASSYTGSTSKTFTFAVTGTGATSVGTLGSNDITIRWADNEGNSGKIDIDADTWTDTTDYEVMQGVSVRFAAGTMVQNDSFTIDAYNPTLQAAQDKGLAQVEQTVHTGFIDLLTDVTSVNGTFSYYYEGVETTVDVAAGSKLQDLVNLINSDTSNRGVVASIVNDGTSTATAYHLVLTGKHTGAQHTITNITETLDNFTDTFETTQKASNAMVKVDGYPSTGADYIQRSSNTISDILDGVSLSLHDSGSSIVTVSDDLSTVESNIEMFVSSINFIQEYIKEQSKYDADSGEAGVMLGNYSFNMVRGIINDILASSVPGLSSGADPYVLLAQIGIKTDPDQGGIWVVDSTALNNALNNDLEAVARLFVGDDEYGSQGVCEQLRDKLEELTDSETGIANVLVDNYNGIIKEIDNKIAKELKRIDMVQTRLEEKFARLEALLEELDGQSDYIGSQIDQLPSL
ncbi:MAG: flagellar filament capping protein FliD [Proteobacteria bacterium]|nr:flagellar filament capping protein FliD [Pseudomonadota bacterium]